MTCRFCGKSSDEVVCDECKNQILAARNARQAMEDRLTLVEDKLRFVMNFFRPSFQSVIHGAPPTVMSLEEFYERRKLEEAAKLNAAQPTGIING